jgi:2-polyprenyl-6-methoxyphenol hydroxylase-like FAD-dependent oxidoreductase
LSARAEPGSDPVTECGEADVLVVGAGPTGLTLAGVLNAMGASVRVVDRQLDRVRDSRALAVQPRTLEVLRGLGVSHMLVERGNAAAQLRIHAGERLVPVRLFDVGLEDTAYPFLLFISQAETEAVLNEHLAERGVQVERGVEFVGFEQHGGGVSCTLRHMDGRTARLQARFLVGCDGAHSTVRHRAGIPFQGAAYAQTFVLADLEVDGDLEEGVAHAFLAAGGMLFFFPLARPASWRMLGMRPGDTTGGAPERTEPALATVQAIADAFTGGTLSLRDPVWLTYFRLHHRHAARYRAGRIFLAGDAAHVHSPAGAQGMNTGIQEAWNLGWKLALAAKGIADETLLDTYETERRPIGRSVLRFTDRATTIATSENRTLRLLRTQIVPRLAPLVLRFARGRAYGYRTLAQLRIHYRRSPATQEGEPTLARGPRAGDRLPDARIVRDGQTERLHDAVAAPSFHLLLCGSADGWDAHHVASLQERYGDLLAVQRLAREDVPCALHDVDGHACARLGVEGVAQYLVRPDGHIGYRSGGTELEGVDRYLARWLPGTAREANRPSREANQARD